MSDGSTGQTYKSEVNYIMSGWIKLHRSLLDWEWYSKPVVRSVFIHCLLKANHKDNKWQGRVVNRGEFISSLGKIAEETGFSVQQIRTAIKHLKSTSEITSSGSAQHTVFKVNNYDKFQELTSEATNEQQTINKQSTTNKNEKNEKKDNTPYQDIVDAYNDLVRNPFPRVLKVSPERKSLIRKFYSEVNCSMDNVRNYFEAFSEHAPQWMEGGNGYNARGFEFIIKPKTVLQLREQLNEH